MRDLVSIICARDRLATQVGNPGLEDEEDENDNQDDRQQPAAAIRGRVAFFTVKQLSDFLDASLH
jgi:hypothetical protein